MHPSAPRITPYGTEAPVPGQRSARQVLRGVGDERDREADDEAADALEQVLAQHAAEDRREQQQPAGAPQRGDRGAPHDRPAPDVLRPTVRQRATDLLLEREEAARRHHEHQGPQPADDGGVVLLAETAGAGDEERIRRDAGDGEADPDRERALGDGLLGRVERPLCALCHRFLAGGSIPRVCRGSRDRRASVSRHPQVSRLWRRRSAGARIASHMSTRTLILLAAVTGLAILAAGAIQILLAR